MQGYVYDIEANDFYHPSGKIWIINCLSLDGSRRLNLNPFLETKEQTRRKFLEWHNSFGAEPIVASFNGIGYDHWMLWKYLDLSFHIGKNGKDWIDGNPCKIIDLFILSHMVEPDRPVHSLASYGDELGLEKIDFEDFSAYTEEMQVYCERDVDLTLQVFNSLVKRIQIIYRDFYKEEYHKDKYLLPLRALQKDYYLYAAQACTGILFDKDAAIKLEAEIAVEMQQLEDEVLPQLPPRALKETEKKLYTMPAKPFKKDGSLSTHMLNWIEKHNAKYFEDADKAPCVEAYGKTYKISSNLLIDMQLPMTISDNDDIKKWFMQDKLKKEAYDIFTDIEWRE